MSRAGSRVDKGYECDMHDKRARPKTCAEGRQGTLDPATCSKLALIFLESNARSVSFLPRCAAGNL